MEIIEKYSPIYEAIIRRAYSCGRYGVDAADASEYRQLFTLYDELMKAIDSNNNIKKAKYNFDNQANKIAKSLKEAISKFGESQTKKDVISLLDSDNINIHVLNEIIMEIETKVLINASPSV